MINVNRITASVLISFVVSGVVFAARLTLPELASRSAPKPVHIQRMRELKLEPFEDIVARAELILHARVNPITTYLSDDQYDLYTDYLVSPLRVLFQKRLIVSPTPGLVQPIVITRWGGDMVINSVQVKLTDRDAPRFDPENEVIVCLIRDAGKDKYRLVSEISGSFRLTNGVVEPFVSFTSYQRFKGMTIESLEAEVRRMKQ